jgi:cobalt-zinc-cadmium efflux system outer membrane protein
MNKRTPSPGHRAAWLTLAVRCVFPAILASALLAVPLAAQSPAGRLTLDALYRAVDSLSPRIAAARASADAALARVPGNRRLPDPRLQLATMNRQLPGFDLQQPLGMNQIELSQMFPIPGTGKLGLAGDVAQSRADAEQAQVGESVWEQRSRAAMAFYDLYRTDATLAVMRETLRLLEAVSGAVNGMYAVGQAKQADVLRAQLAIGRMTGQITDMGAMRRTMSARLNTVLNRSPDAPTGAPELPAFPDSLPPADSLTALALASRGMIRAGTEQVRAATAAEELAHREIWPDLELGVIYGQQPMQGGGTDRMMSIMLGASVPIWAGSRQLKMRDETAAMRQMAEDDLAAMRADTRGRVAELVAELDRVRELHALYLHTLLPQAEATVASARMAYQVGGVDFMTFLDALMTDYQYRTEIHQLDAREGQALAELEMVTGRPLVVTTSDAGVTAPGGAP